MAKMYGTYYMCCRLCELVIYVVVSSLSSLLYLYCFIPRIAVVWIHAAKIYIRNVAFQKCSKTTDTRSFQKKYAFHFI
jgi:hypothetical protein